MSTSSTSTSTADENSALAALEWALYHKLTPVVVELLSVVKVADTNTTLDGKVKFFLTRTMANELNYADANSFDAILSHLKTLESKAPASIDAYEFIYWKKEFFLQGALSILFRHLLPDAVPSSLNGEDRIPWKKPDDIQIPEQLNVNGFLQAIKDYFDAHSDLYLTTGADKFEGDAEGIFNQDLNEFGKDLTKVENRKKVLSKQKIFMLFKNRSWESRISSFLDFFSKLESELYSTQPYLLLTNKNGESLTPSTAAVAAAATAPAPVKKRKPRQPKEKKQITVSKVEGEEKETTTEEAEKPAKKARLSYGADDDSSDSENQPDEVTNALLNLKNIAKKRKSSQANLTSAAKAGPSLGEDGEPVVKKQQGIRKKWTPSEDSALQEGLIKYGEGCWKQILEDPEFSPFLQGRTNINLKDRYRNLLKKGYKIGDKLIGMETEAETELDGGDGEAVAEC